MVYIQVLKGNSIRMIYETFQHSSSTISLIVHDVSAALMRCERQLIPKPDDQTVLSERINNNTKYLIFDV